MIKSTVGIEAEFLLIGAKDEVIIPPSSWDRDGFPLLGEIRGHYSNNMPDVVANFTKTLMETNAKVKKGCKLVMEDIRRIRLVTYKAAMRQVTEAKGAQIGKVKNVNGISIDDFSDQVIGTNGKIQGMNISCGLHIHFACGNTVSRSIDQDKYEFTPVTLPINLAEVKEGEKTHNAFLTELIKPEILLYSRKLLPKEEPKKLVSFASVLTKPVIEHFVREMDKAFFKRFAPKKEEDRTKYRQAGFYELKPYGFEYRSLPANEAVIQALPEIVDKAFALLDSLKD